MKLLCSFRASFGPVRTKFWEPVGNCTACRSTLHKFSKIFGARCWRLGISCDNFQTWASYDFGRWIIMRIPNGSVRSPADLLGSIGPLRAPYSLYDWSYWFSQARTASAQSVLVCEPYTEPEENRRNTQIAVTATSREGDCFRTSDGPQVRMAPSSYGSTGVGPHTDLLWLQEKSSFLDVFWTRRGIV